MVIFFVLAFQVLFILFAMSINVALVVHDKINLQNSLDLAAYYGAKKQAEVLNAMAHINYQMRQNWKLLAWRYRILGTLGQDQGRKATSCPLYPGVHPISHSQDYWCPQNKGCNRDCTRNHLTGSELNSCIQAQAALGTRGINQGNYCDRGYFLCISNDLWKRGVKKNVNMCWIIGTSVPPIEDLNIIGDWWVMQEASIVANISNILQNEADQSCKMEGALNWLMTQTFLSHFRLDQKDRKTMMREIYKRTLKEGKDLDGNLIFEGAKKVFRHNLNEANKKNFLTNPNALKDFNSFKDIPFKDIFEYVNTFPVLQYLDNDDDEAPNGGVCSVGTIRAHYHYHKKYGPPSFFEEAIKKLKAVPHTNVEVHPLYRHLNGNPVENLFLFNSHIIRPEEENNPIGGLTLSFVKKPEQVLYYALRVEFKAHSQNQIFSLNLSDGITFKASSFAKAFGGRFGPTRNQSDFLIPIADSISNINPSLLQPNYSRWPGDQWGLLHKDLHFHGPGGQHFLKKYAVNNQLLDSFHYDMGNFLHLILYSTADDPLARPLESHGGNDIKEMGFIRLMELMAIYPDLYDLSYYSISANYMRTYFPKICKLLRNGSDCQSGPMARNKIAGFSGRSEAYIRGDFGWPEWKFYLDRNQQKKQVDLSIAPYFLKRNPPSMEEADIETKVLGPNNRRLRVNQLTSGKIFYKWLALDLPAELLSSWAPTRDPLRYNEYKFPEDFLTCVHTALKGKAVQSSCAVGGRSGYSVKLISCEAVQAMDSPPPDINEYCP